MSQERLPSSHQSLVPCCPWGERRTRKGRRHSHLVGQEVSRHSIHLHTEPSTVRADRLSGRNAARSRTRASTQHPRRERNWLPSCTLWKCASVSRVAHGCCESIAVNTSRDTKRVGTHYFSLLTSWPNVLSRFMYRVCSSAASRGYFFAFRS